MNNRICIFVNIHFIIISIIKNSIFFHKHKFCHAGKKKYLCTLFCVKIVLWHIIKQKNIKK